MKRVRCRHAGPPSSVWTAIKSPHGMFHRECQACGAWLSLGPANDEPEAVKVEIDTLERWLSHAPFMEYVSEFDCDCIGCQKRELANAIHSHKETP